MAGETGSTKRAMALRLVSESATFDTSSTDTMPAGDTRGQGRGDAGFGVVSGERRIREQAGSQAVIRIEPLHAPRHQAATALTSLSAT